MEWNEDEVDLYTSEGTVTFKVEKFSEFARGAVGSRRLSKPAFIGGRPWRILAKVGRNGGRKYLHCYLQFETDDKNVLKWISLASRTVKILAQTKGKQDMELKEDYIYRLYNDEHEKCCQRMYSVISFEDLMAHENGWYDRAHDTLILSAYVETEAAKLYAQNKELRAEKEKAEQKVRAMEAKERAAIMQKQRIEELLRAALAREEKKVREMEANERAAIVQKQRIEEVLRGRLAREEKRSSTAEQKVREMEAKERAAIGQKQRMEEQCEKVMETMAKALGEESIKSKELFAQLTECRQELEMLRTEHGSHSAGKFGLQSALGGNCSKEADEELRGQPPVLKEESKKDKFRAFWKWFAGKNDGVKASKNPSSSADDAQN